MTFGYITERKRHMHFAVTVYVIFPVTISQWTAESLFVLNHSQCVPEGSTQTPTVPPTTVVEIQYSWPTLIHPQGGRNGNQHWMGEEASMGRASTLCLAGSVDVVVGEFCL